jgi:hypothetical protein
VAEGAKPAGDPNPYRVDDELAKSDADDDGEAGYSAP